MAREKPEKLGGIFSPTLWLPYTMIAQLHYTMRPNRPAGV